MKAFTAIRVLVNALWKNDEHSRFFLAERLAGLVYPKYKFSDFGRRYLDDRGFLDYYERFHGPVNYHSLDRKYLLDQLMKLTTHVPGDTAECGVYKGATSYLICRRTADAGKRHYIFDSFAGLSEPEGGDGAYWRRGDLAAQESEVRHNLREFDFVEYLQGWIPERFHEAAERRFSFVHIDVDLYQPTLDSVKFFYARMSPGAVLVCDDYGFNTCPGAQRALDEFFADKPEEVVDLPTGQAMVVKK